MLTSSVLMSLLAYRANRSYVFEDYTWSHTYLPYTIYDFALRPARIPLNAFISGPSAGGPMPAPRTVSAEYWDQVCSKSSTVSLSSKEAPNLEEGSVVMDWWLKRLTETPERCVVIENDPPVFDQL